MRWIGRRIFAMIGLASLLACGGPRTTGLSRCEAEVGRPRAVMPACVETPKGAMAIEDEYLPGVVQCEVGGMHKTPSVLEAQAIVARTYLLAHLLRTDLDRGVPLTSRFQCFAEGATAASREAVARTRDVVLHHQGQVLDANYAAGVRRRSADCSPLPPDEVGYARFPDWEAMRAAYLAARLRGERRPFAGVAWTEVFIVINEGRTGLDVRPSPWNPARPTNRGAFGQWAALCLARERGAGALTILRYFFGADVELTAAHNGQGA